MTREEYSEFIIILTPLCRQKKRELFRGFADVDTDDLLQVALLRAVKSVAAMRREHTYRQNVIYRAGVQACLDLHRARVRLAKTEGRWAQDRGELGLLVSR